MKLAAIQDHHPLPFESQNLRREMEFQNAETNRIAKRPNRSEKIQRILEYIDKHGPAQRWQIAKQLGIDYERVRSSLRHLSEQGRIVCDDEEYSITVYTEVRS